MSTRHVENSVSTPDPRPYWWPAGASHEQLSDSLRAAIEGVMQPAYEELVVAAKPGLEQSTGATIVNLLWLEILQQTELGQDLLGSGQQPERLRKHEKSINRLLRWAGRR